MCLAVPAKVIQIRDGKMGLVEIGGIVREACFSLLEKVETGDYVLLHAGFAIERLDPGEAEETLEMLRRMDALHD